VLIILRSKTYDLEGYRRGKEDVENNNKLG